MITCSPSNGSKDITPFSDSCSEDRANQSVIVCKSEIGTQYCSSDCYICPSEKRSIATQTLKSRCERKRNASDIKIIEHVQSIANSKKRNPLCDHNNCIPASCYPPDSYLEKSNQSEMPADEITESRSPDNNEKHCNLKSGSENGDNDSSDDEFQYHSSYCEESSDESGDEMNNIDPVTNHKTFVFESQLKELFKFCQECRSPVSELTKTTKGSIVTIHTLCLQHHECTWQSQPTSTHKNIPVGNLLIPAGIVYTGGHFKTFQNSQRLYNLRGRPCKYQTLSGNR